MSAPIAKLRAWNVTVGGVAKVIAVLATDSPDSIGGGGAVVQQFKFVSDFGDYVAAYSWNGTTLGTVAVNILKPHKIRCSIAAETIQGVVWNYSYAPAIVAGTGQPYYTRTAVSVATPPVTETQLVTPDYLSPNDLIFALPIAITNPPPAVLLSATVASGGTGGTYAIGNVLTLTGGAGSSAQLTVTAVAAGKITAVSVSNPGWYTTNPTASNCPASGGGGSGATFNLTLSTPLIEVSDGREWAH
jgi:hypothetical protein